MPSWSLLLAMTWYALLSRLYYFLSLFPSQSLNIVESPRLRRIFKMLRADLKDTDIPGHTTIRSRVTELLDKHLEKLETEMKVLIHLLCLRSFIRFQKSVGKISFTMDMWSDPILTPFMAVTAHWVESATENMTTGPQTQLTMQADLIGFHRVPGRHTGHHLAYAFLHVLDRIKITDKVHAVPFAILA